MARFLDMGKLFKRSRDAPTKKQSSNIAVIGSDKWGSIFDMGYTPVYNCPEVMMCVDVIADLVSNMTIRVLQNTPSGDKRVVNGLSRAIDIEPNSFQTRKSFIYNIVSTMLTVGNGNCIVFPKFDRTGLLQEMIPFKPSQVVFEDNPNGGYYIRYGDKKYERSEVLHFVINPDPERPWLGRGLTAPLKSIVNCIEQANNTKKGLLSSPFPSLVVHVDGLAEEFTSKDGRKKLLEQYINMDENGVPWIIPSEVFDVQQVKPLSISDLAISENLELDQKRVAGLFHVPAFMVGVGNFNRDEYDNFITTKIMSIAQIIQQEMTKGLLYSPEYHISFNQRSLHSYSISELVGAGKELVDRMAMRRNEWRDWLGLSPDDDMDDLLALENYIPADKLGDQNKLKGGNSSEG